MNVSTSRDCSWSVAADAPWVSINADGSGQGEASIPYTVAANPLPSPRSGAIVVGSERVQLSQAAAPCVYTLSRSAAAIGADGGSVTVDLSTLTGCAWTASSDSSWIVIAGGASGSASGTVTLQIAANGGAARVGRATIGGQIYTVTQEARSAAPAPAPPPAPTPTPAPQPKDESITLEGSAFFVNGRCPDISFWTDGHWVSADGSTEFKRGRCSDISAGDSVKVTGSLRANGVVDARSIELRKR